MDELNKMGAKVAGEDFNSSKKKRRKNNQSPLLNFMT